MKLTAIPLQTGGAAEKNAPRQLKEIPHGQGERSYRNGCDCEDCIASFRVAHALGMRKKKGYIAIYHAPSRKNAIENQYPEVIVKWIRRKANGKRPAGKHT